MDKDKDRKSWMDKFLGGSPLESFNDVMDMKGGGGYSIRITQTPEGKVVKAKLSGNMNRRKVKEKLRKKHPNAKIEIEGGKQDEARFKVKSRKKLRENTETRNTTKKSQKTDKDEKERVSLKWKNGKLRKEDRND